MSSYRNLHPKQPAVRHAVRRQLAIAALVVLAGVFLALALGLYAELR